MNNDTMWQHLMPQKKQKIDWKQVHIQASIAAMQGMLSSKETMVSITKQASNHNISIETALAKLAVVDADALIAELQKKDDNANV